MAYEGMEGEMGMMDVVCGCELRVAGTFVEARGVEWRGLGCWVCAVTGVFYQEDGQAVESVSFSFPAVPVDLRTLHLLTSECSSGFVFTSEWENAFRTTLPCKTARKSEHDIFCLCSTIPCFIHVDFGYAHPSINTGGDKDSMIGCPLPSIATPMSTNSQQ